MKISDIRDPALFQRLVHTLFAAERGYEFQLVDDSGGDRGNDGYDAPRGILYSIYCPEKQGPDAKYLRKLRADLAKAVRLSDAPGYHFAQWIVVTPSPLREPVQAALRSEAAESGLTAAFMTEYHLEAILLRVAHLRDLFPELSYPRVDAALQEIDSKLGALLTQRSAAPAPAVGREGETQDARPEPPPQALLQGFSSPILAELQERVHQGDLAALGQLERYRLEAIDPKEQLAALLVEVQHRVDTLEFPLVAQLSSKGLGLANRLGLSAESAIFASHRALALAHQHVTKDLDLAHALRIGAEIGIPIIGESEVSTKRELLRASWNEIQQLFADAVKWAKESRDLTVMYTVMLHRGNATTQLAFPFFYRRETGDGSVVQFIGQLKGQAEQAYETAIPVAKALNDKARLAAAYSNFANDLRFFGEKQRAIMHAKHALQLALEIGDERQVEKTKTLLERFSEPVEDEP